MTTEASNTAAAPAKESAGKKVLTFLDHVGQDFEHGFEKAAPIIAEAEPVVDALFPSFGPLFASTLAESVSVEQKFAAMGKQSGTGTQKAAEVLNSIEPVAAELFAQAGLPNDSATISKWINGVVGLLNGIPAPPAPAAAA